MPYLISTGKVTQNNVPVPMSIVARLNLDSQGISVAKDYAGTGVQRDASKLKDAFAAKKAAGGEIKVAMTFPGGTHDLWIRYWLAAGGIHPDKDVSTIVVPPPQMVANMKVGNMDAFCVGEPWNEQLVNQGIGFHRLHHRRTLERPSGKGARPAQRLDRDEPERREGADDGRDGGSDLGRQHGQQGRNVGHPRQAPVVQRAAEGRRRAAEGHDQLRQRTRRRRVRAGDEVLEGPRLLSFKSHDRWFLTENIRWGKFAPDTDIKGLVDKVNREDIWRAAAADLGITDIPASTSRGPETFFDGKVFDPEHPEAYLDSLTIKASA